jgi:hypothetical protein
MEIAINYWAVLVAGVVVFVLGGLWYGPLFGKQWMRMMGYTAENMKGMKLSGTVAMSVMAVLTLIMMYVLAHGIAFGNIATGMSGATGGMVGAFWYWLGFVVPLTASSFLWENKGWKLWAFNAAYYLVALLIAGAIIGGWA